MYQKHSLPQWEDVMSFSALEVSSIYFNMFSFMKYMFLVSRICLFKSICVISNLFVQICFIYSSSWFNFVFLNQFVLFPICLCKSALFTAHPGFPFPFSWLLRIQSNINSASSSDKCIFKIFTFCSNFSSTSHNSTWYMYNENVPQWRMHTLGHLLREWDVGPSWLETHPLCMIL